MQIHRFRDAAAISLAGKGETRYMSPEQARIAGRALIAVADSIERESFAESPPLTVRFHSDESPELVRQFAPIRTPGNERVASEFSARWPAADDGRYRVALYKGTFATSPVIYRQDSFSDHRTLKAAVRRLAHIIARQSRRDWKGERFDAAYIVAPSGERWPLNRARAILAERERLAASMGVDQ